MAELVIATSDKRQIVDITDEVARKLSDATIQATIFVKHTTAAITTADLDPGTDLDFLDFLAAITPNLNWRHPHDPAHAPDHFLASVIGPSLVIPVNLGRPDLGTWQRIVLVELDGPKERHLEVVTYDRETHVY